MEVAWKVHLSAPLTLFCKKNDYKHKKGIKTCISLPVLAHSLRQSVTRCTENSWHGSVWSWRDNSVMGSVKRLSEVPGLGPNIVPIAFLRGKLSNVISAHSDRGPWSHKGLAVLASPHPGPITFAGEERPTSEVPNYTDATADDAPADNRSLYP